MLANVRLLSWQASRGNSPFGAGVERADAALAADLSPATVSGETAGELVTHHLMRFQRVAKQVTRAHLGAQRTLVAHAFTNTVVVLAAHQRALHVRVTAR